MEKINLSGIYCIENLINGKKYIGQAKNFCIRWNTHKYNLKNGKDSFHLQKAFDIDGFDNFEFYIIEECSREILNEKEMYWIEKYKSFGYNGEFGYNLTSGSNVPLEISNDTRWRMSNSAKNKKPPSLETKRKLSEAHKGENHHLYGKHHLEETKKRISKSHKGIQAGKNNPMFGKHLSEEAKDKIRIANSGKKHIEKYENQHSEENFGRKLKNSTSKYRGVSWDSKNKKWFSQFNYHQQHYFLGRFIDEISAAKAYDQKIFSLSGKKEFLNFPEEF